MSLRILALNWSLPPLFWTLYSDQLTHQYLLQINRSTIPKIIIVISGAELIFKSWFYESWSSNSWLDQFLQELSMNSWKVLVRIDHMGVDLTKVDLVHTLHVSPHLGSLPTACGHLIDKISFVGVWVWVATPWHKCRHIVRCNMRQCSPEVEAPTAYKSWHTWHEPS